MNLSYNEICAINQVQLQIFKEFTEVCKSLGLTYYMIHGSLLGAIRYNDFFPYDDDIDIAMPRKDFEILIQKGQEFFRHPFFLQSYKTDPEYPLSFAKLRNSETAFIQSAMNNFNINKGIYIDIFPIDYYPESSLKLKYIKLKETLYSIRISSQMSYDQKQPIWKKIIRTASKVACPSLKKAIEKRANLFVKIPEGNKIIVVGGKGKERGIPKEWFSEGTVSNFAGMEINCPFQYKEYLSRIYGDYENYNPAEKYMNADGTVNVSANKVSTTQSYRDLI